MSDARRFLLLILLSCLAAPPAGAMRPTLLPDPVRVVARQASNYGANSVADFNHDGFPDVAVPGIDWRFVDVLLGRGDGTFDVVQVPHQDGIGMAIGDFNEDGNLDFASGRYSFDQGFWVFLGHGDGTFEPGVEFPVVGGSTTIYPILQVTAADFDHDGHLDIAVYGSGGLHVAPGNGDGTFRMIPRLPLPCGYTGAGDFDGDGRVDLACKSGGQACVRYGLGDGTFEQDPERDCVASSGVGAVATGDLDGDGKDDFVAAGTDLTAVTVQSDRTLQAVTLPLPFRPRDVELAELDADGNLDIVASSFFSVDGRVVATLTGRGDGTFDPPSFSTIAHGADQLEVADFDMDGRRDLGAVSSSGYTFAVIPGRGDGTFPSAKRRDYEGGSLLAAGDVDNDGDLDLISPVGLSGARRLLVRLGDGRGGFDASVETPLTGSTSTVLAADLDGDEFADVVLGSGEGPSASLLLGLGDGTFDMEIPLPLAATPAAAAAVDFNQDGLIDLAFAGAEPDETVQVFLGQGDGSMTVGPILPVGPNLDSYRRLIAADLDGDGNPDLVATNPGGNDLSIHLGYGADGFGGEHRVFTGNWPADVTAVDVNRNGRLDLVVCIPSAGELSSAVVLLGRDEGGFAAPLPIATPNFSTGVAAADFDGDGRADLMLKHAGFFASFTSSLLLGNGDGTFVHHATHPTGSAMQIGDFDKDGRPDLATGGIHVFLNQGPFTMMFEEDTVTLGWPYVDRAESYDVYRGSLSELADETGDGAADDGYGTCRTDLDDDPTDNSYVDEEVPGEGRGFFYLRTGVGNLLAVDLGVSSSGVLRAPAEACP